MSSALRVSLCLCKYHGIVIDVPLFHYVNQSFGSAICQKPKSDYLRNTAAHQIILSGKKC